MAPNPNWNRWFYASLAKHFSSLSDQIPFFLEGQIRSTTFSNYAELRIDGPYFNEISHALWEITLLAAIIIEIVQDDNDLYKIHRYTGNIVSIFNRDIPIYRYGDQEGVDDALILTCLKLSPKANERIKTIQFGQTQSATNIIQASIEARYETLIYTPGI